MAASRSREVIAMMSDKHIRLGSIVIEKAENKPLRVLDVAHETAEEHDYIDVRDPENKQWGVKPDDPVYECAYLTTSGPDDSTRPPSRTYAFPEGRLYRYRCEAALPDDARRIHTQILEEFLADVFTELLWHGASRDLKAVQDAIVRANERVDAEIPTEVLVEEAEEIAEASLASHSSGGDS